MDTRSERQLMEQRMHPVTTQGGSDAAQAAIAAGVSFFQFQGNSSAMRVTG